MIPSERAVQLAPDDYKVWSNRGWVFAGLKQYEEAIRFFDRAIKLNPSKGLLFSNRGQALLELEQYQRALADFTKEIEVEPTRTRGWLNRGIALERLEQFEEALASFENAIGIDPAYTDAWALKGALLNNLRRYEDALAALKHALDLGDRSAFTSFNYTVAELGLNRWNNALVSIDNMLSRSCRLRGPWSKDAEKIVRALFDSTRDINAWQDRTRLLVELYVKYKALHALGIGLVKHVSDLSDSKVSAQEMQQWRDIWIRAAGNHVEFEVPLRLLGTALKYIRTKDPLTLLEIAEEERQVLEPLLGLKEESDTNY
jgi:tetratricopeptide (TPR) repeat protein